MDNEDLKFGSIYYEPPNLSSVILKISGNCNLNCSYCYWFKKPGVRETLGNMSQDVVNAFIEKLGAHIKKYKLKTFHISLHGGEPLLFQKTRFVSLCEDLKKVGDHNCCDIRISINTNAVLVDDEWAAILKAYVHNVGISIDGPKAVHDRYRIDLKGGGSFDRVKTAAKILKSWDINYGVLCVAQADCDARELLQTMVEEFGAKSFDVLIPDATHQTPENEIPKISKFYKELFDVWIEEYVSEGVNIRIFKNIMRLLMGFSSSVQSVGLGGVGTTMIMPGGEIEALDVLHYLGQHFRETGRNIFTSELQDVVSSKEWLSVWDASQKLPAGCSECQFKGSCGGGHIVSRWSLINDFNNKSVYCDQLKEIFSHVANHIHRSEAFML